MPNDAQQFAAEIRSPVQHETQPLTTCVARDVKVGYFASSHQGDRAVALSDSTAPTSRMTMNVLSKSLAPGPANLTPKERLVLAQVIEGLSSKEIARVLDLSPRTIEFHRANLLRKWAAKNAAHLALKVRGD
jgi:DNA-binding NarL/FixJ family response regulator